MCYKDNWKLGTNLSELYSLENIGNKPLRLVYYPADTLLNVFSSEREGLLQNQEC